MPNHSKTSHGSGWIVRALTAGFLAAALPAGSAQTAPGPIVAGVPVSLATRTPLGEARIEIPAGTAIESYEVSGDWVRMRKGPFSGWVAFQDTSLAPRTTPKPSPEPSASPSPANPPPTPENIPARPAGAVVCATAVPPSSPPADYPLTGALAFLAAAAVLAWLSLRRRCASLSSELEKFRTQKPPAPEAPAISAPEKPGKTLLPDPGFPVPCPLCGVPLPADSFKFGRNSCPSCAGSFVCE
jgi:hypothetical protein